MLCMDARQEQINRHSAAAISAVQDYFSGSEESILSGMRRCMPPKELRLYDFATFCEREMLVAFEKDLDFSACTSGAAMVEAILALMCLRFPDEVKETRQYKYSNRKHSNWGYEETIQEWSFEQLITVAEQCNWLSAESVDQEIRYTLAEMFLEVVPDSHPELGADEIKERANAILQNPGSAMLRMAQMLRNSIHAGRWIKQKGFIADSFSKWCRFGIFLCADIRTGLLSMLAERSAKQLSENLQSFKSTLSKLPIDAQRALLKEATKKIGLESAEEDNSQDA